MLHLCTRAPASHHAYVKVFCYAGSWKLETHFHPINSRWRSWKMLSFFSLNSLEKLGLFVLRISHSTISIKRVLRINWPPPPNSGQHTMRLHSITFWSLRVGWDESHRVWKMKFFINWAQFGCVKSQCWSFKKKNTRRTTQTLQQQKN